MSIISAMIDNPRSYADAFKAADITSAAMKGAIREWYNLYYNQEPAKDEDPCMEIPYTTVRKLTKTVFSEYAAGSKDDYANMILESMGKKRKSAFQKMLIGGEAFMKPVPTKTGWKWTVVSRNAFLVFGRDIDGNITDIGTAERSTEGKYFYTLLERRTVQNDILTIRNMLYRSDNAGDIGSRVPLATLSKYELLQDEYTYTEPIGSIGLVPLKVPIENNVDGTDDGVSVYSAAVGLTHNINRNEAEYNGEFDRAKSRVFVSDDLLKTDKNGRRGLNDTIFVGLDGTPDEASMTIFSPEIRDQPYERRKQGYLKGVESVIGLKRGILSEVEEMDRTATEITSSDGDYNLSITDLQEVWTSAVEEAMRLCDILGRLYNVPGAHTVKREDWRIDYGDGVLYNPDKEEAMRYKQVAAKLLQPERYLGWYYNLPCETPEERKKIREEYMPEQMDDAGDL